MVYMKSLIQTLKDQKHLQVKIYPIQKTALRGRKVSHRLHKRVYNLPDQVLPGQCLYTEKWEVTCENQCQVQVVLVFKMTGNYKSTWLELESLA